MDLSSKMPATQDSMLAPRMAATMTSDAPATGGGEGVSQQPINRDSSGGVPWEATGRDNTSDWIEHAKDDGQDWVSMDRKGGI